MSTNFKFVPESIDAFKRTARDLQRCYPITLQTSQNVLAQVYGYADLHALQEHLKLSPPPGFQGGVEDAEISRLPYTFVLHQEGLLLQLLGDNQRPKGRAYSSHVDQSVQQRNQQTQL